MMKDHITAEDRVNFSAINLFRIYDRILREVKSEKNHYPGCKNPVSEHVLQAETLERMAKAARDGDFIND